MQSARTGIAVHNALSPTESGPTNHLLMVTYVGPRCAREISPRRSRVVQREEHRRISEGFSLGNRGPTLAEVAVAAH